MRNTIVFTVAAVFISSSALAVSDGKVLIYKGSPQGIVSFDGAIHKKSVSSCKECHNEGLFPKMKQGSVKITMAEINAGKQCGVCHNGKKAFEAKANCTRCHTPPQ